ncbi:MAG: PD-(D/E)XK nuclease family protein [Deltaproteobacteria bacterium]|nr:PD-(D/E)XK nuclease family protein [Deltaproteobacteria bacterium]
MPTIEQLRQGLHLSFSQMQTYMICPESYRFQYVRGVKPEFVGSALPFGNAIHEALASYYRQIQATGEPPSLEALKASFADHWSVQEEHGKDFVRFKGKETWSGLKDMGVGLLEAYYTWRAGLGVPTHDEIVAVELPLSATLGDIEFIGAIDLILRDRDKPDRYHLIDHKTSARRFDETRIATDHQLTAYRFLVEESGYLPMGAEFGFYWDVLLKQKNPVVERYSTVRTEEAVKAFLGSAKAILRGIDHEVYFPSPGWGCTDCGFAAMCSAK